MSDQKESALIIGAGAGPGISSSFARLCHKEGMSVSLAARSTGDLAELAGETDASVHECDVSQPASVDALFDAVGTPDLVLFNPSYRTRGSVAELDREEVYKTLMISCYGGFLVGQVASQRMLERGSGTILFTGASASVKGYPLSAPFAMGKFGLRGLAQSMARELHPKNIHIGHFVIDGGVSQGPSDPRNTRGEDGLLEPDAIAETYMHLHRQHRSSWTWEVEVRPWGENF